MDKFREGKVEILISPSGEMYHSRMLGRDLHVLKVGFTCERHMQNGEIVWVNRQPTLHKPSAQAKRAIINWFKRTFDTSQLVTKAFNLDYDGDELNLHLVEDQQARAEIVELMMSHEQIWSQEGDCIVYGLLQNSCMGIYQLTHPSTRLTRRQFQQYLMQFERFVPVDKHGKFHKCFDRFKSMRRMEPFDKEKRLYTGWQLISALLPIKHVNGVEVGVTYHGRSNKESDPNSVPARIENSFMIGGQLWGDDVAPNKPGNLVHTLVQDIGAAITVTFLAGMQRVLNYYIMDHGFTMGPGDYAMSPESCASRDKLVENLHQWCLKYDGEYDMRRQNGHETRISMMIEGTRKAIFNDLLGDIAKRDGLGCRKNGMVGLVASATKGNFSTFF
jgi:DNA-directed RNA polymerase II subunit RPB1